MKDLVSRFERLSIPEPNSGCYLWLGRVNNTHGYPEISFGRNRYRRAHRVAVELAGRPIPEGKFVLHKCDNILCVNPDHLYFGTQADNVRDMRARGRAYRPTRGKFALTLAQATEIADAVRAGESRNSVARRLNVSRRLVGDLLNGHSKLLQISNKAVDPVW